MKCYEFNGNETQAGIRLNGMNSLAVGERKLNVSKTITDAFPWFGVRRLTDVDFEMSGETITGLTAAKSPASAQEPLLVYGSIGLVTGSTIKATVNGKPIHAERATVSAIVGPGGPVPPSVVYYQVYEVLLVMKEGDSFSLDETYQVDEPLSFREWWRGKKAKQLTVNRHTALICKNGTLALSRS